MLLKVNLYVFSMVEMTTTTRGLKVVLSIINISPMTCRNMTGRCRITLSIFWLRSHFNPRIFFFLIKTFYGVMDIVK